MLTVFASLISGLVGALASTYYYISHEKVRVKRDTLRRFAGNRHALLEGVGKSNEKEFIQAVNEIMVVFNDDPEVMSALSDFYDAVQGAGEKVTKRRIVALLKAMCDATGVDYSHFDDQQVLTPFGVR